MKRTTILVALVALLGGCGNAGSARQQGGENTASAEVKQDGKAAESLSEPDIFIVGGNVLWRNEVCRSVEAEELVSVFYSDENVYIAGSVISNGGPKATLWKNLKPQTLNDKNHNGRAKAVFVDGNDVYVTGVEWPTNEAEPDITPVLWKNGEKQILAKSAQSIEEPYVQVAGGDVYVALEVAQTSYLWKNGELQTLPAGFGYISSLFVSGKDVYICGSVRINDVAVGHLWKNGELQALTDGSDHSQANSVFVSGKDVYVAGGVGNVATLWKNGKPQALSQPGHDTNVKKVIVYGADVYVLGFDWTDNKSYLWKNGTPREITDGETDSFYTSNMFFVN